MLSHKICRRSFLKYGVAGTASALLTGLCAKLNAGFKQGPQPDKQNESTTLFNPNNTQRVKPTRVDAHGHTVRGLTPDKVFALMDLAGISHMVLMARGRNDWLTREIYAQNPQRILPFIGTIIGTMYRAWHNQDERVLTYAEKQLQTGMYKGVGEVMLRYYGNRAKQEPEIYVPADSPFIKRLADIVEYHDAVMIVHMEPEPRAIQSLENLLDYNKKLKLIWAHCGTMAKVGLKEFGYADLAAIMERHLNLYTDISGV
jgi:predicted TIM-barrel fold metal-dependent hydrolase